MPDYTIKLEQELPSKTDIAGTDEVRIVGGVNGASYKNKLSDFIGYFADMLYPVGSYYDTSDPNFDPNVAWGGVWELEDEGLVHIGAGENYEAGDTGGEATHKLTAAESGTTAHGHTNSLSVSEKGQVSTTGGGVSNSSTLTSNGGGSISGSFDIRPCNTAAHFIVANSGAFSVSDLSSTTHGVEMRNDYGKIQRLSFSAINHTHTINGHGHGFTQPKVPAHTHSLSGAVAAATAADASSAHNNMQPYVVVNRWHRTA